MTGFAASHTGSLTPSSNPWTFVGTVTWQSDIDPAILPDNEPVVLRLAFTTLSLTGATIAFTSSGSGRAATLPANGPFDGSTDYTVASHKNRTVTYTIPGRLAACALYNAVLSAAQVTNHYSAGA